MSQRSKEAIPGLIILGCQALQLSQTALGELLGASKRTAQRWQAGEAHPKGGQLATFAAELHKVSPELAGRLASAAGTSLQELGIVPAPAAAAPPGPTSAPLPPAPARPPVAELIDAVVCAAAEANDVRPREIRAALAAAFTRARRLGLTIEEAEGALRGTLAGAVEVAPPAAPLATASATLPPRGQRDGMSAASAQHGQGVEGDGIAPSAMSAASRRDQRRVGAKEPSRRSTGGSPR